MITVAALRKLAAAVFDGATNVSIIATDREGLITFFNTGAENMLGYRSEEIVGKPAPGFVHRESEMIEHGLESTSKSGKPIVGFNVLVEKTRNVKYELLPDGLKRRCIALQSRSCPTLRGS